MSSSSSILNSEDRRKVHRRLTPFYVAASLQSFVLWYAIEKPFLAEIGLTASQMATAVVVLNAVLVVANLPVGIVADRWSRRGMLMFGGLALSLASLVGGFADALGHYLIAMCCFALFQATYAGGYDAVVYDVVVEETGSGDAFSEVYGRVRVVEGVALSVSSLLGGVTAALVSTRWAYLITVPIAALSIVALLKFKEPSFHRQQEHVERHKLFATMARLLRTPQAVAIILTMVAVAVGFSFLSQLDQLWLLAVDFPLAAYGPYNALLLACFALGGLSASWNLGPQRNLIAGGVALVSSFGLLLDNTAVILIVQCTFTWALTLLTITLNQRLHDLTPTSVRASVASVVATVAMLVFAPAAIAFGQLSETLGVFKAAWILVAVACLTLAGLSAISRLSTTRLDSETAETRVEDRSTS